MSERYAYDGNGNRTRFEGIGGDTATATYDDQDRLIRYKNTRFAYTASGELAKAKTGNDSTLYTYDPLGNLVLVALPNGSTVNYMVDGRNRRVARKLNGVITHRWLYQSQLEPVAEFDGGGNLVARYVYGTQQHVPDYVVKGGVSYRIITDHLGSVRMVVNSASGAVLQRIKYGGYGVRKADSNPGFQCFGFAGGLCDSVTELVRFGARDLDVWVGRWTTQDPNPPKDERTNHYIYAGGDPTNNIDIDGLSAYAATADALEKVAEALRPLPGPWPKVAAATLAAAALGLAAYNAHMARDRGNYVVDDARAAAQVQHRNPCDVLEEWMEDAKCKGNTRLVKDIEAAQKYLKCRNIRKRGG